MQILPTNIADLMQVPSLNMSLLDDKRTSDFLDAFNEALEDDQDKERPSEETTAASPDTESLRAAAQVQTPYARNSHNGITYTLDEVCFTRQELQDLRNDLLKAGASKESLSRLTALAELPDGANLAQVMASVKGNAGTPLLSDEDKNNITALLNQIDPSGILNTHMQALMQSGQGREALDMLRGFVEQLDPTGMLDISRDELLSLGRGLGLDDGSLQGLAGMFGKSDSRAFLNGQVATLLGPASEFFARQQAEQAKLDDALKKTLQPRISAARARTEKERQANELQNRDAMHSKVHIDRTVQQDSRNILDSTLAKAQADAQQATERHNLEAHAAELRGLDRQEPTGFPTEGQGADSHGNGTKQQKSTDRDKNTASGWQDLLQRTEVKPAATGEGTTPMGMATSQALADATRPAAEHAGLPRQAVQDVTQAMLSSLKDGAKRMDLQLSTAELGTLSVSLTVRNGEVSALLRSDSQETADMLQRQLEHIRVALEEQGLKVDKVEVQLQAKDEQNMLWQDLDQHNFQQEQHARREAFARLRSLASVRQTASQHSHSALERSMHIPGGTASSTQGGLNLVA